MYRVIILKKNIPINGEHFKPPKYREKFIIVPRIVSLSNKIVVTLPLIGSFL